MPIPRFFRSCNRAFAWVHLRLVLDSIPHIFLLLFLASSLATSGQAQPGPPSEPQVNAEKFTVSGSVENAVTGDPIRRALVMANGYPQRSCFSDDSGQFEFEGVARGQYQITAQKPNFRSEQELPGHVPPQLVEITANTSGILVKLTPQSTIRGRVTDAAGNPLEHVPMRLTALSLRDGRKRYDQGGFAQSGEDGRFRFGNLAPGTYYVSAGPLTPQPANYLISSNQPRTGYPYVYFPAASDLASAAPIRVAPGQNAEADFTLNQAPVYNVSGTVAGYGPEAGVGFTLLSASGDSLQVPMPFHPESGKLQLLGLPAGQYILKAHSQATREVALDAEIQISVTSNLEGVHIILGPAITIPVAVRMESSNPQSAPAGLPDASSAPPVQIRLLATKQGANDAYSALERTTPPYSIVVRNLEPGRYIAEVTSQGTWYVQSATYQQTNLLAEDLTLSSTGEVHPIEIVLRDDGATLTGTVNTPKGAPASGTLLFFSDQNPARPPKRAPYYPSRGIGGTLETGFEVNGLAPGEYTIIAVDQPDSIEYINPEALRPYLAHASHVTLAAKQKAKVSLELTRTSEVSQ